MFISFFSIVDNFGVRLKFPMRSGGRVFIPWNIDVEEMKSNGFHICFWMKLYDFRGAVFSHNSGQSAFVILSPSEVYFYIVGMEIASSNWQFSLNKTVI